MTMALKTALAALLLLFCYNISEGAIALRAPIAIEEWAVTEGSPILVQRDDCKKSICAVQIFAGNTVKLIIEKPLDKQAEVIVKPPYGESIKKAGDIGARTIEIEYKAITASNAGPYRVDLTLACSECQPSHAIFVVYVYDQAPTVSQIGAEYGGHAVQDGQVVKSGWWIFAASADAISPFDTVSFCVIKPSGKYSCSSDNTIDVKINDRGAYRFISWNKSAVLSDFTIYGDAKIDNDEGQNQSQT